MNMLAHLCVLSLAVSACAPDETAGSDTPFDATEASGGDASSSDAEVTGLPRLIVAHEDGTPVGADEVVMFHGASLFTQSHTFELRNAGMAPLDVASIAWEGAPNRYFTFTTETALPRSLAPDDALMVTVDYAPPLGVIDDFSASVLLITSNATDATGAATPTHRLRFDLSGDLLDVRVAPTSYVFRNATPARPENQDFTLYNEGTVAATIDGVALETSSAEFSLSGAPAPGTVLQVAGSPGYSDLRFKVTYTPTSGASSANVIIVSLSGEELRIPITGDPADD